MFKAIKAMLEGFIFPTSTPWALSLPGTRFDYAKAVGDGLGSNVIMSPVQWMMRTFPEAPVIVEKLAKDGYEKMPGHKILELLEEPNEFYPGEVLWMGTMMSFAIAGNAYWLKRRNNAGRVSELYYVPHWTIEPKAPRDGRGYITHYDYNPMGVTQRVEVEDVVHFRHGINPKNIRQGLSPLDSVVREVFTDDEAANFSATILKNMGVPGVIISPEAGVIADENAMKAVKEKYQETFGGDHRGEALVLKGPTKVQQFGFNPAQMSVGKLRNISEERVCAALGIPAAVVGFGTGLQQTKVGATMAELIRLAWKGNIIPTQRLMAATLRKQLLPDFEPEPKKFKLRFDNSEVQALQEDRNKLVERLNIAIGGGWATRSEGRRAMGWPVEKGDEVYFEPAGAFVTPAGQSGKPKQIKAATPTEGRVIETAPRKRPTRAHLRLGTVFAKDHARMSQVFEKELSGTFDDLGRMAEEAADELLKAFYDLETKDPQDTLDAERILASMPLLDIEKDLRKKYQAHYLRVSKVTTDSINGVMGLGVQLPDTRAREIISEGGRRLGLVDVAGQTRRRLFRELEEGRALGEGVPQLVARIRDKVPAGRWSTPGVRAKVIARTETKHAQRKSALETYKEADTVTQAMVLDARLGSTDEECEALNGTIVSLEDAEALMNDEHPNGTRDFVPMIGE
ncbi:MAG: phage portal protein [Candidatus Brocadiales bacterium]|nr:phage portal protein [Candidatus Bathyanammoxibius amoris]